MWPIVSAAVSLYEKARLAAGTSHRTVNIEIGWLRDLIFPVNGMARLERMRFVLTGASIYDSDPTKSAGAIKSPGSTPASTRV